MVSVRSLVPSRAAQITTPNGVRFGTISRVAATRVNSTPPARVGMTTASAPPMAARTMRSSPGGVSTTAIPSLLAMARTTVRSDGPSTSSTPSIGLVSSHSAADACRSASTSTTGS